MNTRLTDYQSSPGFKVRKLRVSRMLTRPELAQMASVSLKDVNSFENNLSSSIETKLQIIRILQVRNADGAERTRELAKP